MITVALLAYNREKYIKYSLNAILNQTYKNSEILIIDNHSSDNTHNLIIETVGDRENTTIIRLGGNSNPAISYNTALQYSKNPYVIVTHDDDVLELNYVEKCYKVLSKNKNIGLIGANVRLIDELGKVTSKALYPESIIKNDLLIDKKKYFDIYLNKKLWIPTPTHCINRNRYFDYYENNQVYTSLSFCRLDEDTFVPSRRIEYEPSGDIESCLAINEVSDIYFFSEPMLSYRQHNNQESRNVEQSDPLLNLCRNITTKDKYFSIPTRLKANLLFQKYYLQKLFFENEINKIKVYLKNKNLGHPLVFILRSNFKLSIHKDKDLTVHKDNIYSLILNKVIDYNKLKNKKIILVGSMLMSYVLYQLFELNNIKVNHVIDRAPARIGKKIFTKKILSYESICSLLNQNQIDFDNLVFITTSERIGDSSIKDYLHNKIISSTPLNKLVIYDWRELFN